MNRSKSRGLAKPAKPSTRPPSSLARTGPTATVPTTPHALKTPLTTNSTTDASKMKPASNTGASSVPSSRSTPAQLAMMRAAAARNAPVAQPPHDATFQRQQQQNMGPYSHYAQPIAPPGFAPGPPQPANPTQSLTDELAHRILQQLMPSMKVLNENQSVLMRQTGESQDALRGEMAKLREDMKAISERSMKHEAEDKLAMEKHIEEVKALTIIADRMGTIQQNVEHVSGMIGKSKIPYGPQRRGMLDIMEGLEMDLQEWLEKARDPTSNDSASSLTPVEATPVRPPAVLPVVTPPVVRHEMATSPIKPLYANAAVSQTPPPPSPSPKISRPILPTLVFTTSETPMQPDLADLSPLSSVSRQPSNGQTAGPDVSLGKTLISEHPEVMNAIAVTADVGVASVKDAMEVDDHTTDTISPPETVDAQQAVNDMEIDSIDVQSASRSVTPAIDSPSSAHPPVTATTSSTNTPPRQVVPCNVPEREASALGSARLKTQRLAAFSPVDWTKALATSSARVPTRSLSFQSPTKAPFVSPTTSSSPTRTYSLPAPPEGSIAALRQQTLGALYLLDSPIDASRIVSPVRTTVIAGDAAEAAERMLSPESDSEGDESSSNSDDVEKTKQPPEESLFTSPLGNASARRSSSVESSLTSLSSHGAKTNQTQANLRPKTPQVEAEDDTATSSDLVGNHPPPSQSSATITEEDTVRSLLEELPSPVKAQPSNGDPLQRTSTLESWLLPAELLDSPRKPSDRKPGGLSSEPSLSQSDITVPTNASLASSLREWHSKKGAKRKSIEKDTSHDEAAISFVEGREAVQSSCSPTPMELDFNEDPKIQDSLTGSPSPFIEAPEPEDTIMIRSNSSSRSSSPDPSPIAKTPFRRSPSVIVISSDDDDDLPKPPPRRSNRKSGISVKKEPVADSDAVAEVEIIAGPSNRPGPLERSKAMEQIITPPLLSPISDLTSSNSSSQSQTKAPSTSLKQIIDSVEDDIVVVPKNRSKASTSASSSSRATPAVSDAGSTDTRKSLLVLPKKGQNTAATRIKKRKLARFGANSDEEEDVSPPLKKARLRGQAQSDKKVGPSATVTPKSVVKGKSPAKLAAKVASPATPSKKLKPRAASVMWPKMNNPTFDQFIQCNDCSKWYHVGCVGVQPDDIRLSAKVDYRCLPCEAGIIPDGKSFDMYGFGGYDKVSIVGPTPSKSTGKSKASDCSRPKCLLALSKTLANVVPEKMYTIESFVGLWKKNYGGTGMEVKYLVKWQGYGLNEATWEPINEMGLSNEAILTSQFEADAEKEGLDLDDAMDDPLYLKAASRAGWNSDGLFVKRK